MNSATPTPADRELAHRSSGGLEVTLFWNSADNTVSVQMHQPAIEETIAFLVAPAQALDAFHHPYTHLPSAA